MEPTLKCSYLVCVTILRVHPKLHWQNIFTIFMPVLVDNWKCNWCQFHWLRGYLDVAIAVLLLLLKVFLPWFRDNFAGFKSSLVWPDLAKFFGHLLCAYSIWEHFEPLLANYSAKYLTYNQKIWVHWTPRWPLLSFICVFQMTKLTCRDSKPLNYKSPIYYL